MVHPQLDRAVKVVGVIRNDHGEPVEGVQIMCSLNNTKSDQNGHFDLGYVADGTHYFMAQKQGFSSINNRIQVHIEKDQPVKELELSIKELGEDQMARLEGICVDKNGEPIANVAIQLRSTWLDATNLKSDNQGKFRLEIESNGHVSLSAYKRGLAGIHQFQSVKLGGEINSFRLVMAKEHLLSGRVVDVDGQPISGATWKWTPSGHFPGILPTQGQTDDMGRFEVLGVDVEHGLVFSHDDYESQTIAAPLTNERHAEIVMEAGEVFRGKVIDANSKQPITSFKVSVAGEQELEAREILSGDGSFERRAEKVHLTRMVRVVADGYQSLEKELVSEPLNASKASTVFNLKKADLVVAGVVQDSQQQPWAGLHISLLGASDPEKLKSAFFQLRFGISPAQIGVDLWDGVSSDAQGRFRFDGVAAEQALALIVKGEGVATELTLGLENYSRNQLEDLRITVAEAAIIQGRVSAKEYPEIRGLSLFGLSPENRLNEQQLLREDGTFSFESLPEGRYRLVLNDGSYNSHDKVRKIVTVVAKEVATVNFGEEEGTRLSGLALMAGRALPNGLIFLLKEGAEQGDWRTTRTDGTGLFQFESMASGNYHLVAFRGDYGFRASPQSHSNRISLTQNDEDQYREFQFRSYGAVRGKWLAMKAGFLQLRGKTDEGLDYSRWLEVAPGAFEFPEVASGIYSLSSQTLNRDQGTMRTLVEEFVMPEDGSDVDLGDVGDIDEAVLRFQFSGDDSAVNQKFSLEIRADNADRSFLNHLTAALGTRKQAVAPGNYSVQPRVSGPFMITVNPRDITLVANDQQTIQVHLRTVTHLHFNSSNKDRILKSAIFTAEDGREFHFSTTKPADSTDIIACIDHQSGFAKNLPAGAGHLRVIAEDGAMWEEPLTLKLGSTLNLQVFKPHRKKTSSP